MLNVDLTRAARSHAEHLALIAAVEAAPKVEPETDWIEWKSDFDLSAAEGRFRCARAILGFGNRDPDYASRYAHGCAYLAIGVEPGRLTCTTAHDPADIEQWLGRYVAAAEPQWSVDYIDVGEKTVMLITVEAPRWGDPIFTLRQGFGKTAEGAVFVRRNGKTDFASSEEIARLTQRASRKGVRVNVSVAWDEQPELQAVSFSDEAMEAFAAHEAERLERFDLRAASAFVPMGVRDMRSPRRYDADVARYLERLSMRARLLEAKHAVEFGIAELKLAVLNQTDLNYASAQVTLRLPSDIAAFFDAEDLEDALEDLAPPKEWGSDVLGALLPRVPPPVVPRPADGRAVRRLDDATVVMLPSVDVRPQTPHALQPVYLVIPASHAGQPIEINWRTTSTSAEGDVSGVLAPVVSAAIDDVTEALFSISDDDDD